jgi:hypothetical protein
MTSPLQTFLKGLFTKGSIICSIVDFVLGFPPVNNTSITFYPHISRANVLFISLKMADCIKFGGVHVDFNTNIIMIGIFLCVLAMIISSPRS